MNNVKLIFSPLKWLPIWAIDPISRLLKEIIYPFLGKRRDIAMANLTLVFDNQLSISQKQRILKQNLRLFGYSFLELANFLCLPKRDILKRFVFYGEEYLKTAYACGKGIIAVSAHMGNFPLLSVALCLKGYKVAVIAKLPKQRPILKFIKQYTDKIGLKFISPTIGEKAAFESLRHLKKGGILFLQLDQNAPAHRAMIPFFNYNVPVPRGPVLLAQKTGAAILPIFTILTPKLRHLVFINPKVKLTGNLKRDLCYLMRILEIYVRYFPEQWWWWHRRWKEHIDY
ncbi:MAG TPA: hypothetical protein ENF30_00580 [Candidatus Desulfofervidus auxilii]|uniref:Lipid A biosynthesis acyltransferase n=1 Tax=Desulfofervidus auxilii TaxID=1621989 RepID=A0A7V0I9Q6_DESA2|nr:hypothetical protein [Candidatus Desulfofervidus auxilii]